MHHYNAACIGAADSVCAFAARCQKSAIASERQQRAATARNWQAENIESQPDHSERLILEKSRSLFRLREFHGEHLSVLEDSLAVECAKLLIRIATTSKTIATINMCLHYTLHICNSIDLKQDTWDEMTALLNVKRDEKCNYQQSATYAALLALFEFAVSRGLRMDQYIQRINKEECSDEDFLLLEELLSDAAEDRDSRVRIAALRGLSELAANGRLLSFHIYLQVKNLCKNSSKIVRTESLHILKMFADRCPEIEVTGRNDAKLRLVDDAFATVCHAINDVEVSVRAVAARLLGDFQQVSDSFLDQTLDKKLLNAMRMSKTRESASKRPQKHGSRHQRSQASSEWSTGRRLGEDVPVERFDEEQSSIISSGACGAFVTALEDEFMIVRQAGVYSLGRLAADRPFLAAAALDHLADMFNDEIEQVRLDAVRALTPLVVHGVLQKEQLDTILTVLDDALPDSREALRVLLSKSTLGTPDCLRYTVEALLKCMKRFPIDRHSIFKCMSELGRRHATFVQLLCDELLELHPTFDIKEPSLDNQFYLAKLIFVLNGASVHDPVCSLLPGFAVRHYKFLRCSMPSLVPIIHVFSEGDGLSTASVLSDKMLSETGERTRLLLERTYGMLREATLAKSYMQRKTAENSLLSTASVLSDKMLSETGERTRLLLERTYGMLREATLAKSYMQRKTAENSLLRDMDALREADERVAGTAQFLSYLLKILTHCDLCMQILCHGGVLQTATNSANEGLRLVQRVVSSFSSVDNVMLAVLEEFRFQLSILRLAALFEAMPSAYEKNAAQLVQAETVMYSALTSSVEGISCSVEGISSATRLFDDKFVPGHAKKSGVFRRLRSLSVASSDAFAGILVGIAEHLKAAEAKKIIAGSSLGLLFQTHTISLPMKFASLGAVSIKWAQIVEPPETPSEPMRFVVGLPLGVSMNILLHNFSSDDICQFRIQTDYPDRSSNLFRPRAGDFKKIAPHTYRLLCSVLVQSNSVWSDSARVRFGCVLKACQVSDLETVQPPSDAACLPCVPVVESPSSIKQAAIDIPIHPIVEPPETPSEPMRFVVGLPLGVSMNILLHNFSSNDICQFRIQVGVQFMSESIDRAFADMRFSNLENTDYPDRSSNLFRPRAGDFKKIAPHTYRLLCSVLVQSNSVWSDSARVRFGCVLKACQVSGLETVQLPSDTACLPCVPVVESPSSIKQAAIDIPIHPVQAKITI
ncbi:unnamed protein product [Gongylonema pulchrum]|uniref:Integrator complex subunit 4 n=1 Tax=Gongylonema pulchrum TaxID=637853 RepID=A0A183DN38_9BILA|nr:unnamed protein product [Gongylonema pulchrum]